MQFHHQSSSIRPHRLGGLPSIQSPAPWTRLVSTLQKSFREPRMNRTSSRILHSSHPPSSRQHLSEQKVATSLNPLICSRTTYLSPIKRITLRLSQRQCRPYRVVWSLRVHQRPPRHRQNLPHQNRSFIQHRHSHNLQLRRPWSSRLYL